MFGSRFAAVRARLLWSCCALVVFGACTESGADPAQGRGGSGAVGMAGFGGFSGFGGTGGFAPGGAGGLLAGMGGAGGGAGMARGPQGSTAVPCDVAEVLKNSCQSCHGAIPLAGVPMSLMSWEDFQAPLISNPAQSVAAGALARIHDTQAPMPPTSILEAGQLAVLDSWLNAQAPAGTDPSCEPELPMDGGTVFEGGVPPFADKCYEIRVHDPNDVTKPLTVSSESYGHFYFDAPWPAGAQGVWFETLDGGHPEILHHWLVYSEGGNNRPDGDVDYPTNGSHSGGPTLVAGWAPGADNNDIPSDVGLALDGPNRKMSLEFHFFVAGGGPYETDAGVKICTVETEATRRPNEATVSWLGTEAIFIPPSSVGTAEGNCTPNFNGTGVSEIHLLRSWPHMHLAGRKMESTIVRANGEQIPMHPPGGWPFDFDNEVSHETRYTLYPGDRVVTRCHYQNETDKTKIIGYDNEEEMCFNFVTAYPPNALVGTGIGSFTGSSTACLQ